jgi:uncharacterized membrane protein
LAWQKRHLPYTPDLTTRKKCRARHFVHFVRSGDIGTNTLLLHPDTTSRSLATPNRLEVIEQYVWQGGALIMVGGYMTFQGIEAKARYAGTSVERALPVTILLTDGAQRDLVVGTACIIVVRRLRQ